MSYPGQKKISQVPIQLFYRWMMILMLFLIWAIAMTGIMPARADGGGLAPTNTPTQTSVVGAQSAPSLMMSTPEVNTFEIVIGADQNATVQVVTPDNQAIMPRFDDQGVTAVQEEQFASPLWVFGFFAVVIIILVLNSIGRSFRRGG